MWIGGELEGDCWTLEVEAVSAILGLRIREIRAELLCYAVSEGGTTGFL